LFSVGLYILSNIMNRRSISGNNTEQVLQLQITDLQDNLVVTGTNVGVGPGALNQVTTGLEVLYPRKVLLLPVIQPGPEFAPSITFPLPVVRPYCPPAAPEPMATL